MASLNADGYCALPALVAGDALTQVRHSAASLAEQPPDPLMSRHGGDLHPLRWNASTIRPLLADRALMARVAYASAAADLRFVSAYVISKAPRSPALPWHQDWWCWDHPCSQLPHAAQVALLVYLDVTVERNGALFVLPGTHLRWHPLHARSEQFGSAGADLPAQSAVGEVTADAQAGDAFLLDYRLLHRTSANRSDRRRDALLLSFIPDWSGLPREIQAHLKLHPALPTEEERRHQTWHAALPWPKFSGLGQSLPLRRTPIRADFRRGA